MGADSGDDQSDRFRLRELCRGETGRILGLESGARWEQGKDRRRDTLEGEEVGTGGVIS